MRLAQTHPSILWMATILLTTLAGSAAAESSDGEVTAVRDKVLVTMRSAVEQSPETALRASRLAAEVAEIRSSTGAGAPTIAWQREGIGPGFDQRLNAADYLRLTLPFNPPWRRGTNRSLQESTDRLLLNGLLHGRLEIAALAGQGWLELAAETEMAELAARRVERLAKTLVTQTRRYELGEISGSERTQLELELARERAVLRQSEARRLAAEQQVTVLTPGGFPLPADGDLDRLVESTSSASPGQAEFETVLAQAPSLELAETRSEVAGAEAKNQRQTAWGRPEVEVEWERIPELSPAAGIDAAGFRIAFPLPLGKQGRQRILAAEHAADAVAAERDRLERELVARVTAATETAHITEAALDSLRGTVDQIAASEHSLAQQFRLGAISYVVYLDGLSRLDQVRQGMIVTRYTLLAARLELARLLGADTYFPLPQLGREGS